MKEEIKIARKAKKDLIDKLCLGLCDGEGGRCRRYPSLTDGCNYFQMYKAGYDLAKAEVK